MVHKFDLRNWCQFKRNCKHQIPFIDTLTWKVGVHNCEVEVLLSLGRRLPLRNIECLPKIVPSYYTEMVEALLYLLRAILAELGPE